jgi:hypothetical protein
MKKILLSAIMLAFASLNGCSVMMPIVDTIEKVYETVDAGQENNLVG